MSGGAGRDRPMRVAEALGAYLKRSGMESRLAQVSVMDDWPARVGDRIAAVAEPLHVANGVLVVAVRSSAWLMELRMMEAEIRRRVNEGRDIGRIDGIRFVTAGEEDPRAPRRRGGRER
jgi:predicted nucleic acid-binding Zn ribbon protein